ncbi:hypothetical protein QQX10_11395 [Demequina sp. SYSU T00039]|uniref:ABC-2 type transport system permease protein n=1 Tax=Demequina lignilytica TaxID=3051663 RepID=A0AAW7M672_9MICO|nr:MULTISPECIES: hypothetical protein [unclassified Demequina]MDN4478893.1 hypothetical protein [Demequina sp. SYSU T00039-1]MDN4488768.1 hypothetical protein [Demequina sp. SYSU T00039]MDN4491848.1 hypothetical protein [Demequina sp. SYSU T00068]
MVAAVLGIRFRTAAHLLRREWWRALLTGFGVLWVVMMLPSLVWIRAALATQDAQIRGDGLVAIAALAGLGWVVVPLVVASLDDTLDPARFRIVGVPARAILPGLLVAALLTLPAVFFALAFAVIGSVWADEGWAVQAVAYAGLAATLLCMIVGARVTALWGTRLLASRRAKLVTAATMLVGLAIGAVIARSLFIEGLSGLVETDLDTLLAQLALTPLGAGAAVGRSAAYGDWWGAAWRLGLQAGWALLLIGAWHANIARALVRPLSRGSGARRRQDRVLDAPPTLAAPTDAPAAAVHARLRRAWLSDPRYLASLAGVLLLPASFFILVVPVFDLDGRWAYAVPLMLAASVGWGRHNDVAFDSTGLWLDVVSGRLGSAVMRGRMSATVAWGLPVTVLVALATVAWTGRWEDAGSLLGTTVGVLGVSLGIAAVFAVATPYRTPAPGQNPFGAEVGSVGAGLAAQLVSSAVAMVVLPVVVAPFVLGLVVDPRWGWGAAVAGLAVGGAAYLGGVTLAGVLYDKRAGRLLAAVA